jgi:hypothetical protein
MRANLYLDSCKGSGKLPERGSLQETLLLMVFFKRQEAEFLKNLALIQATMGPGKEVEEHFDNYRNSAFPFVKGGQKYESAKVKGMLDRLHGAVVKLDLGKKKNVRTKSNRP